MTIDSKLKNLEDRIAKIETRNKSVETDKAWETSITRRASIALSTYVILATYMWAIGVTSPLLNAIIPTIGFMLSTLSLPFIKSVWLSRKK